MGVIRPNIQRATAPIDTTNVPFTRYAGQRHYELKDHLGNVRAVITDELQEPSTGAFVARQVSRTDYYPFGMAIGNSAKSDHFISHQSDHQPSRESDHFSSLQSDHYPSRESDHF